MEVDCQLVNKVDRLQTVVPMVAPEIFRQRVGGYIFFMVRHGRPNFCQFSPTNV